MLKAEDCTWAVGLGGETPDIDEAIQLFSQNNRASVQKGILPLHLDRAVILAPEFNAFDSETDVHTAVGPILDMMNGILFIEEPARRPLAISSVHKRNSVGAYGVAVVMASANIKLRNLKTSHLADSSTPPEQSAWLDEGAADIFVSDVLTYLRGAADWFDLYKVTETIKTDVHRHSKKPPWADFKKLDDFSRDAQVHRHSRDYCQRKSIFRSNPMNLDEAQSLVRWLVGSWLRWRA
jgi:hypothetical protein